MGCKLRYNTCKFTVQLAKLYTKPHMSCDLLDCNGVLILDLVVAQILVALIAL
jgi:hypothetical protein